MAGQTSDDTPAPEQGALKWTIDDDFQLNSAVLVYGTSAWKSVAKTLPARTEQQCQDRWRFINQIGKSKRHPVRFKGVCNGDENGKKQKKSDRKRKVHEMKADDIPAPSTILFKCAQESLAQSSPPNPTQGQEPKITGSIDMKLYLATISRFCDNLHPSTIDSISSAIIRRNHDLADYLDNHKEQVPSNNNAKLASSMVNDSRPLQWGTSPPPWLQSPGGNQNSNPNSWTVPSPKNQSNPISLYGPSNNMPFSASPSAPSNMTHATPQSKLLGHAPPAFVIPSDSGNGLLPNSSGAMPTASDVGVSKSLPNSSVAASTQSSTGPNRDGLPIGSMYSQGFASPSQNAQPKQAMPVKGQGVQQLTALQHLPPHYNMMATAFPPGGGYQAPNPREGSDLTTDTMGLGHGSSEPPSLSNPQHVNQWSMATTDNGL